MSRTNVPKISVCIPTFNNANYLRQAVESVLKQNDQDFEIVIVDNCSTDHTGTLVEDLQKKNDGRIRFYKNNRNIGLAGNFNKCLKYAQGAYIKFLCSDDVLLPECLEKMAAALDAHQSVTLVCSGRLIFNEIGEKLGFKQYPSKDIIIRGSTATTKCLFGKNYIGEPTAVMFRKKDLTGNFRNDLPQLMDMEMWFQLLEQGDLLSIGVPLCAIRLHSGQVTHTNKESGKLIDDNVKLFDEYSQKPYLEITPLLVMKRKLLMTYRVWVSRKFISESKKKMILKQYASKFAYILMPLVGHVVSMEKWVIRRIKNFYL
jgi:glycosyltransferase involved in cell wall biosynthesis